METELECLATFDDVTEAHLAKGRLDAAGLVSELRNGALSGLGPHLPGGPRVELWCASADLARARAELAKQTEPPRLRASWSVVAMLALSVAAIVGWARVWSLERPPGANGHWNLSGSAYVDELRFGRHESVDGDQNGVFERVVVRGSHGRVSTYLDEDQDGFQESLRHVEDSGATSFTADTDGDGEYDRDVTTVPLRGTIETSWVPSTLTAHSVRISGADGGLHAHLTDDDHDGRFERGVFHVGDGLVITSEDRDGDGFFERREVMRDGGLLFWDRVRADGVIERGP